MRCSVLVATLLAATTLWAAPALAQNEATQPLYQLHGSGTSNPAPIIWRVMDLMMARTKPRVAMSYRSVGSGSGAADFLAGANAFGCGDVPLPNSTYFDLVGRGQTVMHVPYLIGSVSVFHNVPGVGDGLVLPPCTLARIMRGDITVWNHPDILANNTHLPDLATVTAPIRVVHRNPGSSSTYAITHYFNKACPSQWSAVAGSPATRTADVGSSRTVGVTTEWPADAAGRWQTVLNSQEMVEQIAGVPFSLGYVESGQGLNAGLSEVALQNANGTSLVSADSDVAPPSFIAEQFPINNLTSADWVQVNPVYASPSNPRQWPLVLGTYFYVRANATFLGDAGGLLQLFLNFMLGPDVTALMPSYFFVPFSTNDRATILSGVTSALTLDPASAVNWRYEGATNNTFGQQNFVFSARRDSYLTTTVSSLAVDVADAKKTLMMGDAYQVHGSGSFVSAALLRRAMSLLQSRARVPVTMTYRSVGSPEALAEYADYNSMLHSYNHFKVSDMPLPSSVYTSLNTDAKAKAAIGATVQIPFAVAALGIFYNKALPTPALALNCRLLARAYTGSLSRWSDPELVAANGFSAAASSSYLDAPLVVYGMQGPAGSTLALTGWLAASCGDVWGQGLTANVSWAPQVVTSYVAPGSPATARTPILSPDDLAAALASAPGSLGYLPAPLGKSLGLAEAALLLAPGAAAVRSGGADLTGVIARARTTTPTLFTDATADLAAALSAGSNGGGLYGQTANGSWPMPIVQYMLTYRNLTGYGYSGPLLRALAEFLLSSEGAALATASGLAPPPADVLAAARGDLARAALKTLTVVWSSEGAGSYDTTGSALYTFSANRDSWESAALAELQATVADLRSQLAAALPTPLRLACAAGLMPLTRLLRNDLQAIATSPLRFTDEIIPSSSAAASELLAAEREAAAAAPVHLVLTPGPLAAAAWRAVAAAMPVVQLPAALRPVAVVYKGLSGLRLGGCTLARILRGDVTAWNAQAIRDDNPGLALPGNPIRLITAGPEDTDARAVLAYLSDPALVGAGCGGAAAAAAAGGLAIPTAGVVDNAAIVDEVAAGALYSGLGFVAASELAAAPALSGVHAAALPSLVSNTFVRPNQTGTIRDAATCPATGCGGAVAAAYSAAFDEILAAAPAGSLGVPAAVDGDWSNFTARPLGVKPTTDVYPIFRLDFYVAPADLVHFGAAGEAARGLLVYGLSGDLAARISGGLGPAFAGLGPAARRLAAAALAAVQTAAADGGKWAVAASSAAANASQPATSSPALVLSRLPPLADSALPASDAAVFAASSSDSSAAGDLSGTAYQAAAEAVRTTWDKASLAYDIAVAALVLACVLSVAALGLAVWALQKVRAVEGAAVAGGGCFTPAAAKYEKHTDVAHPPPGLAAGGPATTAVEMGAYDKI